jgi:uncharacterized protein
MASENLYQAMKRGDIDNMRRSIASGADVNYKQMLIEAVMYKPFEVVELLIESGADVNIISNVDDSTTTPLLAALEIEDVRDVYKKAELLIKSGSDVNAKTSDGYSPIIFAVSDNKIDIVKLLIEYGANVNAQHNLGWTPLMFAEQINSIELVKILIDAGADLNIQSSDNKNTVLINSVTRGHTEIVDLLLKAGADLNIQNNFKDTALMLASSFSGHTGIVNLLIKAGADLNIRNRHGSALFVAALKGHTEIVDILLKAGADYTIKRNDGKTAFDVAIKPEIRALIQSYIPKKLWKGFTRSDMDKFKTIFETEAPAGQKPPSVNYSCCPVCLAWIERSDACMYMKHQCPNEVGSGLYHVELYKKFRDNDGFIQWCTICGRICREHKHYTISRPSDPKPVLIKTASRAADPFGDEAACKAFGGGGLDEKLSRFRLLRKTALELQTEVGKLEEEEAFRDLVEGCWSGIDISRRRATNMTAKNFVETPSSAFPPNVVPSLANNVPAPNILKPAGVPATRVMAADEPGVADGNFMGDEVSEGNPMLEITYEDGYKERMTQDTLKAAIQSRITSIVDAAFGHCLMYPECKARLYPSDIQGFVDEEAYEKYRKFFNEKFRVGAVGGRQHIRNRKTRRLRH